MDNLCIMCGEEIPEGFMVCPACSEKILKSKDEENREIALLKEMLLCGKDC